MKRLAVILSILLLSAQASATPDENTVAKAETARKACLAGQGPACHTVGSLLDAGLGEFGTQAVEYYQRGCKLGHAPSCGGAGGHYSRLLARLYNTTFESDTKLLKELTRRALEYHEKACQGDVLAACLFLGSYHAEQRCEGFDVLPRLVKGKADPAKSKAYFDRAVNIAKKLCQANQLDVCLDLGKRHLYGCGVPKDPKKATPYLRPALGALQKACRTGSPANCDQVIDTTTDILAMHSQRLLADLKKGQMRQLEVARLLVSSTAPRSKEYSFAAPNLFDDKLTTSWQPLKRRYGGVGDWMELQLETEQVVSRIDLANGSYREHKPRYGFRRKKEDEFTYKNRIRRARLSFSGGPDVVLDLEADRRGSISYKFEPRLTRDVRLTITSIHRGRWYNEAAIAGVKLWGPVVDKDLSPPATLQWVAKQRLEAAGVLGTKCQGGNLAACSDFVGASLQWEVEGSKQYARVFEIVIPVLEKACQRRNAPKCRELGRMWLRLATAKGKASAQGRDQALQAFERGCLLGDSKSCSIRGCHGLDGSISGEPWEERLGKPKPELCQMFCAKGDAASCLVLAGRAAGSVRFINLENEFVLKAIKGFQRQCRKVKSCHDLASRRHGKLASRPAVLQYVEVVALYDRACELGSSVDCLQLAKLARQRTPKSPLSYNAYVEACSAKEPEGCLALARVHSSVQSSDKSRRKAKQLYVQAARLYQKGCKRKDGQACLGAGSLYEKGLGAKKDANKAAASYKKGVELLTGSCDKGDPAACTQLATMYVTGIHVKEAVDKARDFHLRAIKIHAQRCLGIGSTGCRPLCQQIGQYLRNTDAFEPENLDEKIRAQLDALAKKVGTVSGQYLADLCQEMVLTNPCACGCCK